VSKPQHIKLELKINIFSLIVFFILLWSSLVTIYLLRNTLVYLLLALYISILLFINFRYKSELLQILTMIYIYMLVDIDTYLIRIISEMLNVGYVVKIQVAHSLFFGYIGLLSVYKFYQYSSLFALALLFYQFLFMNLLLSKLFNNNFIYKPLGALVFAKYEFVTSWLFGLYSLYNSLRGGTFWGLSALLLSLLFGTRGLILGGVPVILSLIRGWKSLVIIVAASIAFWVLLSRYVDNYIKILSAFGRYIQLDLAFIIEIIVNFFTRYRLQPQLDFFISVIVYILPIILSLFFIGQRNREITILFISTVILFIMFGIIMMFRLSIFENFASDMPYYFLYPSSFLAIVILFKVANRTFHKLFILTCCVFLYCLST